MTTGLNDDVRRTLDAAAHDVEVPPINQLAFQEHVRSARRGSRRRRAAWLAAGSGVVAAGAVGVMVASSLVTGSDQVAVTDGPANFAAADSPTPPVLLFGDGTVEIVDRGSTYAADVDVSRLGQEVIYRTARGLLVVDGQSSPLWVPVSPASDGEPFEVGTPRRLAGAVDNLMVASDGKTGAWFALDEGKVEFVLYDFVHDAEVYTKPVPTDGVLETIVSVSGDTTLVESGDALQEWNEDRKSSLGYDTSASAGPFSSNAGFVAITRDDLSATDVLAVTGAELQKVATVPIASGELSPAGDNVVGFTPYAVDGPLTPDQDPRYLELWSSDGERRSTFAGLPRTVYEFAWLDNDTIALTGGSGVRTWPGELDTYTCELADLTCTKIAEDETGPDDQLPMLASGRGL